MVRGLVVSCIWRTVYRDLWLSAACLSTPYVKVVVYSCRSTVVELHEEVHCLAYPKAVDDLPGLRGHVQAYKGFVSLVTSTECHATYPCFGNSSGGLVVGADGAVKGMQREAGSMAGFCCQ